MRRPSPLLALLALLGAPSILPAQATPPPAPAAPAEPPRRNRAISGELAASLSAALPKYAPPPQPAPKKPEDDIDLRDVDKPRNQIVRLPKYVVQEERPPVFRDRDINTSKGLASLAVQRYLSELDRGILNKYTLPLFGLSAEARALAMWEEEQRLNNMTDLKDAATTAKRTGDAKQADYISRTSDATYMRRYDYGWQGNRQK